MVILLILMLRKSCVVLLVVILLSSLVLGPVAQASVSGVNVSASGHEDRLSYGTGAMYPMTGVASYTTLTLDMSRDPRMQGDPAVLMTYRHDMVHNDSFIRGKMILQRPGEDQRIFPVEWVKTSPDIMSNGVMTTSFVSDMIFPLSMMGGMPYHPPEDYRLAEGEFQFHSVINITQPLISTSLPDPASLMNASEDSSVYNDQISEGQTVWHSADITGSSTTLSVDLKWKSTSDDLRLMIYTPDNKVLGPYYDDSDGTDDSRIYLNVTNPDGVAAGTWSFKVTGVDVASNDSYYLRAW